MGLAKSVLFCAIIISYPLTLGSQSVDPQHDISRIQKEIEDLEKEKKKIEKAIIAKQKELDQHVKQQSLIGLPEGSVGKVLVSGSKATIKATGDVYGEVLAKVPKGMELPIFLETSNGYVTVQYGSIKGYMSPLHLKRHTIPEEVSASLKRKSTTSRFDRDKARWGYSIANKIKQKEIWIGMTSEMARRSIGSPKDINRSTYSFGVREQWVYPNGKYLYFEDGVLTSYQD